MPDADVPRATGLSTTRTLIERRRSRLRFPDLDENAAAAMCYTSGTTGRPKGVVYSHRSTVLHALIVNQADAIGLRERDTVMPIVPMFHANAWGLPYAAALAGAKLVLPGPKMDPADLARTLDQRGGHGGGRGADDLPGDRGARPAARAGVAGPAGLRRVGRPREPHPRSTTSASRSRSCRHGG